MKKLILITCIFYVLIANNSFSQISQPVRLTNGNNDRNPSFAKISSISFGYNEYEFMAYERGTGNYSQICVSKIGPYGAIDSVIYLTNDSCVNLNPVIFYNAPVFPGGLILIAFVAWQSDKFGRQSIFGSFYDIQTGWSQPFIVDSSNSENKKPDILGIGDPMYIIAYESNDDIKYKKFNRLTYETLAERNLTLLESEVCRNPKAAGHSNSVLISYDKEISSLQKAIFYRVGHSDSIPFTGISGDTIAFTGINQSIGFGSKSLTDLFIYETNINGNFDLYGKSYSNQLIYPIIVNNGYDDLNYVGTDIEITDGVTNYIYAYIRKSLNELRFIYSEYFSVSDVLNLKISSDPLFRTKIALSNGVRIPDLPCQKFWFVYSKDSADINYPSTIYGISYTNCLTLINQSEIVIPNKYTLTQNYPNPFNPVTHLEFGISDLEFVSLKVYDVLGNEIKTLVNEMKTPGVYNVEFDGSNLPSGIYFYKITAGKFSEVRKMTLLK